MVRQSLNQTNTLSDSAGREISPSPDVMSNVVDSCLEKAGHIALQCEAIYALLFEVPPNKNPSGNATPIPTSINARLLALDHLLFKISEVLVQTREQL